MADAMARAGALVLIAHVNEKPLARMASEPGVQWKTVDVADSEFVTRLRDHALRELDGIDILLCNAGVASACPVLPFEVQEWDRIFNINARGVFLCAQAFGRHMAEQRHGCIVNISSMAGRKGEATLARYCASKFAVINLTRALAHELGNRRIRANAVCPGTIDSVSGHQLARDWGMSLAGHPATRSCAALSAPRRSPTRSCSLRGTQ